MIFAMTFTASIRRAAARGAAWSAALLWIVPGAMVLPARAQTAPLQEQWVRFTVFSVRPIADLAYAPRPGAAPKTLLLFPTARSPRYEYRGTMPLRFIDMTTGAVVAEARIPPDVRDVLLLFSPMEATPAAAEETPLRYRIAVLDESAARHGAGGLVIINFSGLALSGTVGGEMVTLRAGLNPLVKVAGTTNLALRTTFKERSYHSYSGTVKLARSERALLILFPPFYPGSLEVQPRLLVDEPPIAPKMIGGESGARGRD